MTELTTSPLGVHFETQGPGWIDWLVNLPTWPHTAKGFSGDMCRQIKARTNGKIRTIKRRFDQWGNYLPQGIEGGRRWVRDQGDLSGVDLLESLNEYTGFDDAAAMRQANLFELGFIDEVVRRGVVPVILNLAVGNPREDMLVHLKPCIQMCVDVGGYVGIHLYGPAILTGNPSTEKYLSLRGPLLLEPILRDLGVVGKIKWMGTEGGFDGVNSPVISGAWRWLIGKPIFQNIQPESYRDKRGNIKYRVTDAEMSWAARTEAPREIITLDFITRQYEGFARRLREVEIEACTLFTFDGTDQWIDYEHRRSVGMLTWLSNHWAANVQPVPIPAPTFPKQARVTATNGLRVRLAPDSPTVIGALPFDLDPAKFAIKVLSVQNGWAKLELRAGDVLLIAGTTDPDPHGYVSIEFLQFAP